MLMSPSQWFLGSSLVVVDEKEVPKNTDEPQPTTSGYW